MEKLSPEAVEARREYFREWGAKNRDKRKKANARYWQKCAARKTELKLQEVTNY